VGRRSGPAVGSRRPDALLTGAAHLPLARRQWAEEQREEGDHDGDTEELHPSPHHLARREHREGA
jgi:hypothetical protein